MARRASLGVRAPRRALVLVVSYHGGAFFGSQRQEGKRTVQGELERAIEEVFGVPARTNFAGRTDQGVHAAGQVVSLGDYRPDLSDATIVRALNAVLPDDLAVLKADRRPLGFHARYDALWREYRYRLWCGVRQPLVRDVVWQRNDPLLLPAMQEAAAKLVGTHDLASFAGGGEGVPGSERQERPRGTVRTILLSEARTIQPWWGAGPADGILYEIRVAADGFLPRMVRAIVGALVEIGRGKRAPQWIDELLAARDRRLGPMTAPAAGLTLWRVGYEGDEPARE
ncbi:MAG TPA: tRNA pseudouridine(38-40) synthase TruA [Thermomicrobiales bacterium]